MVEVMLGIWLFILTAGAGFLCGRRTTRQRRRGERQRRTRAESSELSWQELLRFLQYDGSDSTVREREGSVTGNEADSSGNTAGVYTRRPL